MNNPELSKTNFALLSLSPVLLLSPSVVRHTRRDSGERAGRGDVSSLSTHFGQRNKVTDLQPLEDFYSVHPQYTRHPPFSTMRCVVELKRIFKIWRMINEFINEKLFHVLMSLNFCFKMWKFLFIHANSSCIMLGHVRVIWGHLESYDGVGPVKNTFVPKKQYVYYLLSLNIC